MVDKSLISGPAHADRASRANVLLMATVERLGTTAGRYRVRDVAAGGIRVDDAGDLVTGERVNVSVGAVHVAATVRWARAGCAGLAFAAPIDPAATRRKAGGAAGPALSTSRPAPTAGWIDDLRDAYGR